MLYSGVRKADMDHYKSELSDLLAVIFAENGSESEESEIEIEPIYWDISSEDDDSDDSSEDSPEDFVMEDKQILGGEFDKFWCSVNTSDIFNERQVQPLFNMRPGPKVDTKGWKSVDYFLQFFPIKVFEKMCEETNKYVNKLFLKHPQLKSLHFDKWKNIDILELRAFVALEIAMSPKSDFDLWETSSLTQTNFPDVMSYERFELIRSFLHFANNDEKEKTNIECDPLFKIKPIFDDIMPTYLNSYCPHKNVFISEIMPNVRKVYLEYVASEYPKTWKILALCDSSNGYILNWRASTFGMDIHSNVKDTILDLCKPIYHTYRAVYYDDLLSSPALSVEMFGKGLNTCCMICSNCRGMPSKVLQRQSIKLKSCDPHFFYHSKTGLIACIQRKNEKMIAMLSSFHNNKISSIRSYNSKNDYKEVKRPDIMQDYINYRKYVAITNRKINSYIFPFKNIKNYMVIYQFIKEVALVNGHILYKETNKKKISFSEFRQNVLSELLKPYMANKNKQSVENQDLNTPNISGGQHFPRKFPLKKYLDCVVCSDRKQPGERKQTKYFCPKCPNKPALCPECFKPYHE